MLLSKSVQYRFLSTVFKTIESQRECASKVLDMHIFYTINVTFHFTIVPITVDFFHAPFEHIKFCCLSSASLII